MKSYDNYNPAIPEKDEINEGGVLPEADDLFNTSKATKKKTNRISAPVSRIKKENKQPKKERTNEIIDRTKVFVNKETLRWIFGLFLGGLAIYLAISFLSYTAVCISDQSEINNAAIGEAINIHNKGGEAGARLSEFLINESFGVGAFIIILWLGALSLKQLVGKPRFKTVNFTIKCLVALITLSLIIGLVTIGINTPVNWGGYHGRYINEFIINFIGWSGAVLLCLFMIASFIIICMRDVVKWAMKIIEQKRERKRILREKREEELAREREIEEIRRFEDTYETEGKPDITSETDIAQQDENFVFTDSETGIYNTLPDFDQIEYEIKDEDKKDPEEEYELEQDEIPVYETETKDLEESAGSHYVINDEISEDENEADKNDEVNDISQNLPVEETDSEVMEKSSENDDSMVVNVNEISQTNSKRTVIAPLMPGSFPYKFPPYNILSEGKGRMEIDPEEQQENKERIKKTLLDFKIPITSIRATIGPTVTLYEIVPDKGIKVASIKKLVDDIALSLSAEGVRIIAPIPGKGTVGIEVANKKPQMVSMQTIIRSKAFQENDFKLPVAIGSTISNEVYITDLAKMPHLLVAGATGQGKSVGLNAIIASLLYSKRPDELKFVMIDPKMVEFSLYEKIESHYLAKIPGEEEAIVTNMDKAIATLNSLVIEMENRYLLLKDIHTKNIIEYNNKIKDGTANLADGHRYLPYIVVVVDEFADLIMNVGREVEVPIARLAQKARAVGIHVIIATQRPSADVITGMIKGNFTARIAFKVSSGVDSKTILDSTGAQYLVGKGDMLILNNAPITRVQCAFIDTPEVEELCEYIYNQPYGQGAYELPEVIAEGQDNDSVAGNNFADKDVLFDQAARLVVSSNHASTSALQRHFSIGYNRAGKIMDQLEASGIVGPSQGGKPRSVLVDSITLENILN